MSEKFELKTILEYYDDEEYLVYVIAFDDDGHAIKGLARKYSGDAKIDSNISGLKSRYVAKFSNHDDAQKFAEKSSKYFDTGDVITQ